MAKNYDPNKDYAAAIRNESDPAKKEQLKQERQNKIDAMNAAGTNTKGYTNDVYKNSGSGNKTGSTSSGKNNSSGGNKGYYDPNKDYAAAINAEKDPVKKQQLIAERENKINAMNAAGTNTGGYTNDIYKNNGGQTGGVVNKESFGYFDSGKDYAAAINAETDPVKKAQLIQERNNKINYLNATGQNQQGYTNDIYGGNGSPSSFGAPVAMGQYQNQDAVINNAALNTQQQARINQALANDQQGEAMQINPVATIDYQQVLNNTTDPVQKAALQAYFTRMQSNIRPEDTQGVYGGDTTMSLPDQALLKTYQQNYNDAKARGDTAAMNLAHRAAENLRDNYRYYPTANSNGYNLGENDIGWIRDIVVRVDDQGNKYVDQYNQGTVTTTKYDKDGNFVNQLKGAKIAGHDDFVARQWDRAVENGNEDRWTAIRIADANDVNLSASELMAKYGAQGGMGRDLYGDERINGKIANGMTGAGTPIGQAAGTPIGQAAGASIGQAAAGTVSANVVNNAAQAAVTGNYSGYGYFDPNLDYAALIAKETDPTRRAQLMQERENKIAYLNGTGQNPKGYTNAIYGQTQQQVMMPQAMMPEYVGQSPEELQAAYNRIAELEAEAIRGQLAMTNAQLQAAQQNANSQYDDLAREAYINMRQSQNALPQQLAALGISGGGSETANLKLQTNYQNNLHTSEQQRAQMLQDFALQKLQAQTQANSDIAGIQAGAAQNAMNAWQNEQANQNSWNQWLANFNLQLQQRQDSLSQYEYEKAQNELAQAVELAQITGDYSKLKAMGYDTSFLEKQKETELAQLALAAAEARSRSVTGGSGGGTKKSSGGGGSSRGGSAGENVKAEQVLNNNNSGGRTANGYTHILMNYKLYGDSETFEKTVANLMKQGTVSQADYEQFMKDYS